MARFTRFPLATLAAFVVLSATMGAAVGAGCTQALANAHTPPVDAVAQDAGPAPPQPPMPDAGAPAPPKPPLPSPRDGGR